MDDRPLYLRIADEIAGDIRIGRLADGERAPSTRRIVRDFGVAMATATKVIGVLRAAGLVETVPGSGTTVRRRGGPAPAPAQDAGRTPTADGPRDRTRRGGLTRGEIVQAGARIADADGLPLVTMRRVADRLGVSTMALYRHVPTKADLTLRMADSVFAAARLPDIAVADWRRRLEAVSRLFWAVFGEHPWAAEVLSLSRPQPTPNVLPLAEWSIATLHAMGFGAHEAMCAHISLFAHVRGLALARLTEAQAEQDTGMSADDWMRRHDGGLRQLTDPANYPGLRSVMAEPFDFDLDTVFEYGLQRLLDGVAARRRALMPK